MPCLINELPSYQTNSAKYISLLNLNNCLSKMTTGGHYTNFTKGRKSQGQKKNHSKNCSIFLIAHRKAVTRMKVLRLLGTLGGLGVSYFLLL
jgi:hypothetical protein